MFKHHKFQLIFSSLLTLLPAFAGIFVKSKWLVIMPFILLGFQWLCVFFTSKDPANKEGQNKKVLSLMLWIIPILSLFVNGLYLAAYVGIELSFQVLPLMILPITFIFLGNYMPKCKQNSTIGIKIKYTLESKENWNSTHRFAGKIWFFGGFIMLFAIFMSDVAALIFLLSCVFILVIIPIVYSYNFHKLQLKNGTYNPETVPNYWNNPIMKWVSTILVVVILVSVGFIMFTGDISVETTEYELFIDATYYDLDSIKYSDIQSVEFVDTLPKGLRAFGFSSAKLTLGTFESDEYGMYTRYCYNGTDCAIVIKTEKDTYIFNCKDEAETRNAYEMIKNAMK